MKNPRTLVQIALGAAILTACAWITIGGAVPFTMQTFAVVALAALLGPWKALATVVVYLLLGAVGVPVFSGFRGGVQAVIGPTGGYLVGFLLTAIVTGFLAAGREKLWQLVLAMVAGLIVLYLFGSLWFALIYANGDLQKVLLTCVVPFILPEAAKVALAAILTRRIRRSGVLK